MDRNNPLLARALKNIDLLFGDKEKITGKALTNVGALPVELLKTKKCLYCDGSGRSISARNSCFGCDGKGRVPE